MKEEQTRAVAHPAVVVLLAVCGVTGCATQRDMAGPGTAPATPVATVAPVEEYRIAPGDVLQIFVWKQDALNRTVPVRPDGMISLPLVNDVRAAGRTAMQLRDVLANKLVGYVVNPEVSVVVQEVRRPAASVLGEVRRAGRYEFKDGATVLDMLANAGGVTEFAERPRIVILRSTANGVKRILFNYDKAIAAGGEHENVVVRPDDIIVVP